MDPKDPPFGQNIPINKGGSLPIPTSLSKRDLKKSDFNYKKTVIEIGRSQSILDIYSFGLKNLLNLLESVLYYVSFSFCEEYRLILLFWQGIYAIYVSCQFKVLATMSIGYYFSSFEIISHIRSTFQYFLSPQSIINLFIS